MFLFSNKLDLNQETCFTIGAIMSMLEFVWDVSTQTSSDSLAFWETDEATSNLLTSMSQPIEILT